MADDSLPNGPASPELPISVQVDGNLGAVDFIRRLHAGGLQLRQGSDDDYAVITLADAEEPAQRDHIEAQRRKLQKAAAVLLAMIYAMDRGLESEQAGDAASVALELIEQVVAALDSVMLKGGAS